MDEKTIIFIQKAKEIHKNKYDYSLVKYINSKTKIKIICPTHGFFEQTPNNHLRKRGCPYCANRDKKDSSWFIQKAKAIHGDKYDYSLVDYKNAKEKIKIICPTHGFFEQAPDSHLRGQGCPKCGSLLNLSNKLKKQEKIFFLKARELHPDFDYSLVKYLGIDTKVKIICQNKHLFEQTPYKHLFCLQGCPVCNASGGEQLIMSWLNSNGYSNAFYFQYFFEDCKDKNPLPYDFYIPEKNLLIEYQGEQHYKQIEHFGGRKEFLLRKHHDWLKRKYARKNCLKLLAIPYWNNKEISKILEEELNGN